MDKHLRPLCLLKVFYQYTDEEHPMTTAQLIRKMKEDYDLYVYRTTVLSDMELLKSFGFDIYTIRTSQNKHFLNERLFDLPELKLLIDAAESSKFITAKKSEELVEKLCRLASRNKAVDLKRNLCIEGRQKPINEKIYYIVDALNDAINRGKKVSFQYFQYNAQKEQVLRHDGEVYVFSPYTLVWNGDHYYVVGYSDKHQDVGSFRVDRIFAPPQVLPDAAVPKPEDFDEAAYVNTVFRMYNGTPYTVELLCDNDMMDPIIDRFGQDVCVSEYSPTAFKAEVPVSASPVFYGWVFGFGGKIRILGPEEVRTAYEEMLHNAAASLCQPPENTEGETSPSEPREDDAVS